MQCCAGTRARCRAHQHMPLAACQTHSRPNEPYAPAPRDSIVCADSEKRRQVMSSPGVCALRAMWPAGAGGVWGGRQAVGGRSGGPEQAAELLSQAEAMQETGHASPSGPLPCMPRRRTPGADE